jgi:hypothetical protein
MTAIIEGTNGKEKESNKIENSDRERTAKVKIQSNSPAERIVWIHQL